MIKSILAGVLLAAIPLLHAAQADWPEFRGPTGDGQVAAPGAGKPVGLPLTWSETNNVRWKTEIPHRGWSTPVAMGNQIWLTTATLGGNDFFAVCVDAATGKIVFNEKVFHCDQPEPLGNAVNCYASPSPVIEAGRVYVHFGSYGTACLDTSNAKVVWQRTDLQCRHFRGPGSSIVAFRDLLILTMDGIDLQYMVALDKKTGKTVWKTDRSAQWHDLDADGKPRGDGDYRKAYSTPLVANCGGMYQMFCPAAKAMYSYDPLTGKELWKVHDNCFSAAARPVYANGLAFMLTGLMEAELVAVRVDGQGDVTGSHVAWRCSQGAGRTPSPIIVDDLLYMPNDDGKVTCLETATGKQVWQDRIGGSYCASPIHADGRIYFCSTQGKSTVLKAGRTFDVLATNVLAAGCMASPAVVDKALILRTKTHLYRIEDAGAAR